MLQRHVIPRVADRWFGLGAELFDEGDEYMLNTIETDHKKDDKRCLEMFRKWLATYDNTTWYQIVKALKSSGVQLKAVATELEKNLIGKNNNHKSIVIILLTTI